MPRPLPITTTPAAPFSATVTPEAIRAIVEEFYARCRAHPVLGPVFERQVRDWDAHLARIREFWAAAVLRTGSYAGRPLEAHRAIPGLAPEHFSVWLRLFGETVRAHCSPADADLFMTLAGRMAGRMRAATG